MSVLRKVLGGLPEVLRSWRGAALVSELGMGFWEGRQFRLYRESTLAAAGVETIRFVAAKPFLLQYQELALIQGDAHAVIVSGGTAGGVFVPLTTVNAKYRIDMDPVSTVTVSIGGTVTGGTEREVLLAASGTGGATKSAGNSASNFRTRGLPAGTYFIKITAGSSGATGLFVLEWEDLD